MCSIAADHSKWNEKQTQPHRHNVYGAANETKKKVELKAPRNRVKGLQWNMSKIMASQLQWAYPSHHTRKNKTQRIDCFWGNGQKFSCAFPTSARFLFGSGTVDTRKKNVHERQKKDEKMQPKSDLTKCLCNNLSHANNTAIGLHPISGSKCNITLDQWYFGIGRNKKKHSFSCCILIESQQKNKYNNTGRVNF